MSTAAVMPEKAAPSPYGRTGPAYLESKGWHCLGFPDSPESMWLDPTKPLEEEREEVPVLAMNDAGEMKQVYAQTGKDGEHPAPVFQLRIKPAVTPIGLVEAIQTQTARDAAERRKGLGVKTPLEARGEAEAGPRKK